VARDGNDARSKAEQRFDRALKTHEEAKSVIDQERAATQKKTAQLRTLRLAKEAAAGITALDKKARPKKSLKS
jgi:hypothetical protein